MILLYKIALVDVSYTSINSQAKDNKNNLIHATNI